MERIREAVEQARRERSSRKATTGPALPSQAPVSLDVGTTNVADEDFDYTETRTITVSPEVREKNRLVAAIPKHPMIDTYRMLRTRVLQEMRANNWKVLAVTSPATGSGKTLTAINLAISIGRDLSSTALLIDGDLRRPSIAEYFGYAPATITHIKSA